MTPDTRWTPLADRLGVRATPEPALEIACLAAWLVRSDQVVVSAERTALARTLAQRCGLPAAAAEAVALGLLAREEDELPTQQELLERVASRGVEERRLLVDALLAVAAADGAVHRNELALIRRVAGAVDVTGAAFQEIAARWNVQGATGGLRLPLGDEPITVGRGPDNTVQLPSLSVSRCHARFVPGAEGWSVHDLRSTTGTLVNGRHVRRQTLGDHDLVQVENFCFRLDSRQAELRLWNENDLLGLGVEELTVEVADRRTGRPRRILDGASFSCFSGEVVCITGPSGSGKTTLINALVGAAPGVRGRVWVNGRCCPSLLAHHTRRLGLVPQDDIVHPELTVMESLFYSGALRAVPGVGGEEVRREVERVLGELALTRIQRSRIGNPARRGISGGERKRVNLGQELLDPTTEILILDEPTTGLDPYTGLDIFRLLRQLADQGRLVLVVTHRVDAETLRLMDRILVLGSTGRVVYCGRPAEALESLGVASVPQLFDALRSDARSDELADRYTTRRDRPDGEVAEVVGGDAPVPPPATGGGEARPYRALRAARSWWRQYALQTRRYGLIKTRDKTALLVNFGQVPLIVLGCWLVLQDTLVAAESGADVAVVPGALPFVLVIAAFWLGCVSAVRELVAEQPLARRERLGGLAPGAYLMSKLTVLSAVAALQCALLVGFTWPAFGLAERGLALGAVFLVLLLVALVGVTLGLCASALFRSTEAAVAVLPVLLIPQLLFGGVLAPFDHMPAPVAALSYTMASRWGVAGFLQAGDPGEKPDGGVMRSLCTQFTVPGESGRCQGEFLGLLGLAERGDKGRMRPLATFRQDLAALALLATAGSLLGVLLLRIRPRGWA